VPKREPGGSRAVGNRRASFGVANFGNGPGKLREQGEANQKKDDLKNIIASKKNLAQVGFLPSLRGWVSKGKTGRGNEEVVGEGGKERMG